MSANTPVPTLLTIFVHPDHEEHALYLIGEETLTEGGTGYTVTVRSEERITLDLARPFTLTHREKQLVFALEKPSTTRQIEELANMITTGVIYGFSVKGEIDLGGKIINNFE